MPYTHPGWLGVELLVRNGIATGCDIGDFCPDQLATRDLFAVWLARILALDEVVSPGSLFSDVSSGTVSAGWIEALANEGITEGCNADGTRYCPGEAVLRASVAKLLLRALYGAVYVLPPASGTLFDDIGAGDFAADFIEQLYAEGITDGCSPTA